MGRAYLLQGSEETVTHEYGAKLATGVLAAALAVLWLLILSTADAHAEGTWITSSVRSYHYERSREHVENNWGLGVEHHLSADWSLAAGGYRNSYGERSYYLGGGWFPLHYGYFHFGVHAGAVTGYEKTPASPFLMPSMSIQGKRVGLNIGVVPSLEKPFEVIGFQLKVRMW